MSDATRDKRISDTTANDLEDDLFARALQLEELDVASSRDKGKHPEGQPTDAIKALQEYLLDSATYLQSLRDLELAHSIANAVDTDSSVIANLMNLEIQAEEDRNTALQASIDDPELETAPSPPTYEAIESTQSFQLTNSAYGQDTQWGISSVLEGGDCNLRAAGEEGDVGPSSSSKAPQGLTYVEQQEAALQKFGSATVMCCACTERFRGADVVRLECNDVFCRACLRRVIVNSMQDKTLFPPKCHRKALSDRLVSCLLSEEELDDFKNTQVEVSCSVKTYCSKASCGRFIPPAQITADRAHCVRCGAWTCTNCTNEYHEDDCPEDAALQATLALAADQKWQRCFACRSLVILAKACNHITCRCKAEFCYVCGLQWKSCPCDAWLEENIIERAAEVVDREAVEPLHPQEHQRRVEVARQELLNTHECEHQGPFQRIPNGPRRGFRCEMCAQRHWKYILQCRRCHLRVCEECRRHRV